MKMTTAKLGIEYTDKTGRKHLEYIDIVATSQFDAFKEAITLFTKGGIYSFKGVNIKEVKDLSTDPYNLEYRVIMVYDAEEKKQKKQQKKQESEQKAE